MKPLGNIPRPKPSQSVRQSEQTAQQKKVREYAKAYDRDKTRPYTRGVTPDKMFATSAFASTSAPGKFPRKRPFSQGFCPFLREFAPGKRVSTKKGNRDFGVCYPNSDIEYGKRRILQDAWWHSIILIDKSKEQSPAC
ncbi:hypothetical protein MTR_3g065830 [Medicago truncatula]|uniref:Uncharacterized protein n=1 Tax=Medicago truncatula TaxID=3880 RepID=A0A072UYE7_MEDTR|nr:hypothetical protein MTR_3g065830 [Medicago truncatula]